MAFVRIEPETDRSKLERRTVPVEFGVGARCGAPPKAIFDVKLRLRPKLLGAAQSFLVINTWFDILFDADDRVLLVKPGSDFKLFKPGGPTTELSALLLAFPLLPGVKAESFVLPVPNFQAEHATLRIAIPRAAFVADRPATVVDRTPAAVEHPKRNHPGFESALANVKHDVRRGA